MTLGSFLWQPRSIGDAALRTLSIATFAVPLLVFHLRTFRQRFSFVGRLLICAVGLGASVLIEFLRFGGVEPFGIHFVLDLALIVGLIFLSLDPSEEVS
jgi:hypothetical protein